MFDMISRRGFVSLSAVAAAGLGLAGCSGSKTSEPAGSDAGSAKASSKKETVELQVFAANSLEKALPEVQELYTEQTGTTFADTQFKASGDLVEQMRAEDKKAIHLMCKDPHVPLYERFGYRYVKPSASDHGGMAWHEMVLSL
mgnify:CR=1 FL=1